MKILKVLTHHHSNLLQTTVVNLDQTLNTEALNNTMNDSVTFEKVEQPVEVKQSKISSNNYEKENMKPFKGKLLHLNIS